MVLSAAVLMREHGLAGTSFREVLEHSGAPRGSIYHHFPEGKSQLVEEAVQAAGGFVRGLIDRAAAEGDPVAVVRLFVKSWRATLESSDYRAGCPVVAVATEAGADEPHLKDAAAAAFVSWQEALATMLRGAGVTPARSRRLAALTVASVEGAVVLCRAERSSRPLEDVGAELEALLKAALPPDAAAK
jgi:AcrR family transcriptional regulator